jgi:predicted RNA-binding protein with RPS1 domain
VVEHFQGMYKVLGLISNTKTKMSIETKEEEPQGVEEKKKERKQKHNFKYK